MWIKKVVFSLFDAAAVIQRLWNHYRFRKNPSHHEGLSFQYLNLHLPFYNKLSFKINTFTYQAQNYWKVTLCLSHVFAAVKLQADGHIAQFFDNVVQVSVSKLLYAAALSGRFLLAMLWKRSCKEKNHVIIN